MRHGTVPALHAFTNDVILADPTFVTTATRVMQACRQRVAIHLRGHDTTPHRLLELALELRVISEGTGSWVLVTDRVDIAMVSGVTGAQLTSRSITLADARALAPQLVLGASVHDSTEAWLMARSGATFLVAGSPSETGATGNVAQLVREVVTAAEACPVIAIGGMTPERTHAMAAAGAAGVAAMRGMWYDDTEAAARRYLAAYDEGLRG